MRVNQRATAPASTVLHAKQPKIQNDQSFSDFTANQTKDLVRDQRKRVAQKSTKKPDEKKRGDSTRLNQVGTPEQSLRKQRPRIRIIEEKEDKKSDHTTSTKPRRSGEGDLGHVAASVDSSTFIEGVALIGHCVMAVLRPIGRLFGHLLSCLF